MERIASTETREFFLRAMAPGDSLGAAFDGEAYPALVWAAARTTATQKHRLCAELIATGCRYVVCGGRESAAWEEAADDAFAAQDLPDEDLDAGHLMTSSHEYEPPDEVAFFFFHNTSFGGHDFTRFLVLMIGADAGIRERLVSAIREEAGLG
jgi:hypothetical protein